MSKKVQKIDALVIGAGFSGLYQLHLLRDQLGLNTTVVETGADLGGTWYWNRYPGARCDSESHSYCYLFSEELYKEWEWSERYPQPDEIRAYLNFVAKKLDLRKDILFNTKVVSAKYEAESAKWVVTTESREIFETKYLITAIGCISSANIPNIPGLDRFKGEWYHTGQWPHDGVDFRGKRVAQIGTGSTGIQAAPVIAETAKMLTVFQRTANYSVPARNGPLNAEFKAYVKKNYAELKEIIQSTPNGHPFRISSTKVFDVSEEDRQSIYEAAWEKGGLQFRASFQDLVVNKQANDTAANFLKQKIRDTVKDQETANSLAEIDHPYAAKRPPIDTHYFETFNQQHVSLVDLRKDPIVEITESGIKTESGEKQFDVIVFATGFDAITGKFFQIDIQGAEGKTLKQAWAEGPKTYLGLQTPGFPNLFTITGPGSPSVLCNMPVPIEQHAEWIRDCIAYMEKHEFISCDTDVESAEKWVAHVNEAAAATLLPTAKHSWYLGANVPGKPRVFMPYAGGMVRYRAICQDVVDKGYQGFVMKKRDDESSNKNTSNDFSAAERINSPGV